MNPDAPFLVRLRQHRPVIAAVAIVNVAITAAFVAFGWDEAAVRQVVLGVGLVVFQLFVVAFAGRRPW